MKIEIRNKVLVPTNYGDVDIFTFRNLLNGKEHVAIGLGDYLNTEIVNIRIHSECLTGEVFKSSKCDCGEQLDEAMSMFSNIGGIILYLKQEGRGIGLYNKIDAYGLQNQGYDTVESNKLLSFKDDLREYSEAAKMLKCMNVTKVNLLTNNPNKIKGLIDNGVEVVNRIPTSLFIKDSNLDYLVTKSTKSHHMINFGDNLKFKTYGN